MRSFFYFFIISIQSLSANEVDWDRLKESFPRQRYVTNITLLTLGTSGMIQGSKILNGSGASTTAKGLSRSLIAFSFARFSWSSYNLFTETDLEVYLKESYNKDPEDQRTAMAMSFRNSARSNRLWAAGLGTLTTANYFALYSLDQEKFRMSLFSGVVGTTLLFFNFYYKTAQERYTPLELNNKQVLHGDQLTDQVQLAYTTKF